MREDTLRSRRTRETRNLLVATARDLFVAKGYANTSTSDIVAAAGLARGAFYHHFADKAELFHEVAMAVQQDVTAEVSAGLHDLPAFEQLTRASWRFLDAAQRPEVQRVLLLDGPAVLGWPTMREQYAASGLWPISANLDATSSSDAIDSATRTRAFIMLAAIIEAAQLIAHSPDPAAETERAKDALAQIIRGMLGS